MASRSILKKVRLDVEGDLAIVTLDRPYAMNALDESVVAELEARFREAEATAAKGIAHPRPRQGVPSPAPT